MRAAVRIAATVQGTGSVEGSAVRRWALGRKIYANPADFILPEIPEETRITSTSYFQIFSLTEDGVMDIISKCRTSGAGRYYAEVAQW